MTEVHGTPGGADSAAQSLAPGMTPVSPTGICRAAGTVNRARVSFDQVTIPPLAIALGVNLEPLGNRIEHPAPSGTNLDHPPPQHRCRPSVRAWTSRLNYEPAPPETNSRSSHLAARSARL